MLYLAVPCRYVPDADGQARTFSLDLKDGSKITLECASTDPNVTTHEYTMSWMTAIQNSLTAQVSGMHVAAHPFCVRAHDSHTHTHTRTHTDTHGHTHTANHIEHVIFVPLSSPYILNCIRLCAVLWPLQPETEVPKSEGRRSSIVAASESELNDDEDEKDDEDGFGEGDDEDGFGGFDEGGGFGGFDE